MIHFDFILTDAEAQNLFAALREMETKSRLNAMLELTVVTGGRSSYEAFERDAAYWASLTEKLSNTRVA